MEAELTRQAQVVLCLGFTPGVLIEGSYIKYHQQYWGRKDPRLRMIHWCIDERCIGQRLPKSFEEQIANLIYFPDLQALARVLDRLMQKQA